MFIGSKSMVIYPYANPQVFLRVCHGTPQYSRRGTNRVFLRNNLWRATVRDSIRVGSYLIRSNHILSAGVDRAHAIIEGVGDEDVFTVFTRNYTVSTFTRHDGANNLLVCGIDH